MKACWEHYQHDDVQQTRKFVYFATKCLVSGISLTFFYSIEETHATYRWKYFKNVQTIITQVTAGSQMYLSTYHHFTSIWLTINANNVSSLQVTKKKKVEYEVCITSYRNEDGPTCKWTFPVCVRRMQSRPSFHVTVRGELLPLSLTQAKLKRINNNLHLQWLDIFLRSDMVPNIPNRYH